MPSAMTKSTKLVMQTVLIGFFFTMIKSYLGPKILGYSLLAQHHPCMVYLKPLKKGQTEHSKLIYSASSFQKFAT